MASYVLIHGAGSDSFSWHWVRPLLETLGHEVITPDLPCDDESAGLDEYVSTVLGAIGERKGSIVVGHSLGAVTAAIVAERVPTDLLVLVAGMVPEPGEMLGEWWTNTAWEAARRADATRLGRTTGGEFDVVHEFFNGVPDDVQAEVFARPEKVQAGRPFEDRVPLTAWPDVPTRFLLCRDDRFFPAEFQRRVVEQRLGIVPDEMGGGHLPFFARPAELVTWLETYRRSLSDERSASWRSGS